MDTRFTDAEYAARIEDEAARQNLKCTVKVGRCCYEVTAPISVWVVVDAAQMNA